MTQQQPAVVRIGVVGHRGLDNDERIVVGVRAVLDRIREIHDGAEFVVLSSLAIGADQLVAREARDRLQASLIAPLPFSVTEYERDFTDTASLNDFRALLQSANEVIELPATETRNDAYAAAGRYVVEHCDVLIALWDGRVTDKRGGTADSVTLAQLTGVPMIIVRAANMLSEPPPSNDERAHQGRTIAALHAPHPDTELKVGALPYFLRIGVISSGTNETVESQSILAAEYLSKVLDDGGKTPLDFRIVTTLCDPSERGAARMFKDRCGAEIEVMSPYRWRDFRAEIVDAEAMDLVDALMGPGTAVFEPAAGGQYSLAASTQPSLHPRPDDERVRFEQIRNAYRRVVDGAEIVLIWGDMKTGMTADLTRYALTRGRKVLHMDTEGQINEVQPSEPHHANSWEQIGHFFGWRKFQFHPETTGVWNFDDAPEKPKQLSLGYHQLSAYNRNVPVTVTIDQEKKIRDAVSEIVTHLKTGEVTDTGKSSSAPSLQSTIRQALEVVMPHFVRADQLAIYFQTRHLRASRMMYRLAAAAVTVVIIQTLFFSKLSWLVSLEIGALLAIIGLLYWNRRQAWHEKWINDRFLAEALRIRAFTSLLGRETGLHSDPRDSLVFYRGPQTWLLDVADRLERVARSRLSGMADIAALRDLLLNAWIRDQQQYQAKTAAKNEHLEHVFHKRGLALFAVTLVAAVLHLFDIGHPHNGHGSPWHWANVWIVLAIALPAWGASLQAIKDRMEFRRIAARASRMASVLEVVALRVEEANTPEDLAQAVAAARAAMASENYEWWILLGFRDPALPA